MIVFFSVMALELNVYLQNCRGLRTKTFDFYHNVMSCSHDVLCFTETWLNSGVTSNELFDKQFVVFRRDRQSTISKKTDGGGVMIAVRSHFRVCDHPELQSDAEDLWISIEASNGEKIYICCSYLPPGDSVAYYSFLSKLHQNEHIINKHCTLIMGDFNFSTVSWGKMNNESFYEPRDVESRFSEMIDTFSSFELMQFNNVPNQNNKMLDLVLCNRSFIRFIEHSQDIIVAEDLHHPALEFKFKKTVFKGLRQAGTEFCNFKGADFQALDNKILNTDWLRLFHLKNIDSAIDIFYDTLENIIERDRKSVV